MVNDSSEGHTGTVDNDDAPDKEQLLAAFSVHLNRELDRLGYPEAPKRSAALAADLGRQRTQSFRILKGLSEPHLSNLVDLRRLGVSLDKIMDEMGAGGGRYIDLLVGGATVTAEVTLANPTANAGVYLLEDETTGFTLGACAIGATVPTGALPVESIQFNSKDVIAIVEDDEATLSAIADQMRRKFRVLAHLTGESLLGLGDEFSVIKAFLIDWRLPDIDGRSLIRRIRLRSNAPVFILTGDTSAAESISAAVDYLPSVQYIAKPIDAKLLHSHINKAIHAKT